MCAATSEKCVKLMSVLQCVVLGWIVYRVLVWFFDQVSNVSDTCK